MCGSGYSHIASSDGLICTKSRQEAACSGMLRLMSNFNEEVDMKGKDSIGYFHVCTDGRTLPWMFQDERDFIAGVNRIGICCLRTGVKVISFVLMDNHVHFVLWGTMSRCKAFITLYKQLTGTWIHVRYGLNDFLKLLPTNILLLDTEERLLNTIAYIDRNPVVSGYRYLTTEYQWGSARYVFKNSRKEIDVKPLSTLSRRCQRSMLGTRVVLPGDWRIDGKGMICPDSFIDASVIESYFKTPARYSYFLSKKLEGVVEHELESSQRTFIPDIELRKIVRKMVSQDFGKDSITELDVNARLAIARKLRYSYASTLKQISRMVHLDRTALEGFI